MSEFVVNGNKTLRGFVEVSGSKNAALPLIFATLVAPGVSILRNVPNIIDVDVALEILSLLGAEVSRSFSGLEIDTSNLRYRKPPDTLVSRIRASSYLMGASLARFGICHFQILLLNRCFSARKAYEILFHRCRFVPPPWLF